MTWTRKDETKAHPPGKPFCKNYPPPSPELQVNLSEYLRNRGLDTEVAYDNLWYPTSYLDGWGRVVVPSTSRQAGNMYWQARLIEPPCGPSSLAQPTLGATQGRGMARRWESPHGCSRGDALVVVWPGVSQARAIPRFALVEGPMDALAAAGAGFVGLALMGVVPPWTVMDHVCDIVRGCSVTVVMDAGAEQPMLENVLWLKQIHKGPVVALHPYPHKDLAAMPSQDRAPFLTQQL